MAPDMVRRFSQVVPRHLNPERMLRVMTHCIHKTPKLADCDFATLLGAMQACASLGLEPNTPLGHAYLIPFNVSAKLPDGTWQKKPSVNLIIGYRGYIDLARRSGTLVNIHADVVYEGDDFDFAYGSGQHLMHRPRGTRGKPIEAYAFAKLKDGEAFEVLPYARVLEIRDNSEGYKSAAAAAAKYKKDNDSPWVKHEHEMAAKTMVRRLAKWLPLSLEFANAARLDEMSETGRVDYTAFIDADIETGLAAAEIEHDPETGEVKQIEAQPAVPAPEVRAQPAQVVAAPAAKKALFSEEG